MLKEHDDIELVGECANGQTALKALRATPLDLMFLDIQMPEMDGFALLEAMGDERMPAVIFVTAYDQYAVRAFEVAAVDYLLKPFLEAIGQRLVSAEQQLEEMAFKGLIPRLASLLLRAAEGDEVKGLSHQDLADQLGVYRETVTNALNELKTAGIIEVGRKRITIIDRPRLDRATNE